MCGVYVCVCGGGGVCHVACVQLPYIFSFSFHYKGFFHEQSRPDRDSFITIFWENILPGESILYHFIQPVLVLVSWILACED